MAFGEFLSEEFENPIKVAKPFAESIGVNSQFDAEFHKETTLPYLDKFAGDNNLFGQYFVEAYRGFSIPASYADDEEVRFADMPRIYFEGEFATHSLVVIGKVQEHLIKSLCLSFPKALLLPGFDEIPEEHILHVPVLAIEEMTPTK